MKRRTRPVSERFWRKVEKTDTCWLWQAGTNGTGYGSFMIEGKRHYAHAKRKAVSSGLNTRALGADRERAS